MQALELLLRRAGLRTLVLTAGIDPARLGRALRALRPGALVLGGGRAALDAVGRLVYAVRGAQPGIEVFDFGVNSGPAESVKTLQRLVGVTQDGSVGPPGREDSCLFSQGFVRHADCTLGYFRVSLREKSGMFCQRFDGYPDCTVGLREGYDGRVP